MRSEDTARKLARHIRAHKNLDARLRKSERADGTWTFEIRHEVYDAATGTRKRAYETVGTRLDQAKARLAELTTATALGERIVSSSMTLREAYEGHVNRRVCKPRTAEGQDRHWRLHLAPRFGHWKVRDVNDKLVIEELLGGLRRKDGRAGEMDPGTKAGILATLSAVLDYAVDANALGSNACRQLARQRRPRQGKLAARILSMEEQERLLAYCGHFPWMRPIILTSVLAALRLGEIAGLRWRDVDFAANKLHVRRSLAKDGSRFGLPKGGREATIDLHPALRSLLHEIRDAATAFGPDDPVFCNSLGRPRRPNDIQRAFNKARKYAALSDEPRRLRFHDLRHTAISRLANAPDAQIPWVQEYARHANIATTYGYVHKIQDEKRLAAAWQALNGS